MKENTLVSQLFDLSGKVALVTGCKSLGYDASKALAELGATVVMTRRNQKEAEETAERLSAECGCEASGVALEVRDAKNWESIVENVLEKYGKIDILINNAGGKMIPRGEKKDMDALVTDFLEKRSLESWTYGIDTNLTSVFLGCRAVMPSMRKAGYGKIINLGSIDGIVGRDMRIYPDTGMTVAPDYCAGKGGVINLTKGLAVIFAQYGIYVNSISPGGFWRKQNETFVNNYVNNVPLGRMGRDGIDILGAVAFLASSASDYVVGHNLVVDGGWTAW